MERKIIEKQAVLLVSHFIDDMVIERYLKLRHDLDQSKYDVILLLNYDSDISYTNVEDISLYTVNVDMLNELCYDSIRESLYPGSCHFSILRFFLDHQQYLFYWFVEYDVIFRGNWNVLFLDCTQNLSKYDFLSCHVEKFDELRNKEWEWWHRENNVGYPLKDCVKGFNPICRYSNDALAFLDKYMKKGHSAHSEVMITTCLYHGGFEIGDFGGIGDFVPDGYKLKYYNVVPKKINEGTMRYRPVYTWEDIEKQNLPFKLFHPSKNTVL